MTKKFKLIDCSKNCKMSQELRDSKYCNKQAKLGKGEVIFGCQEALAEEPEEVRQPYNCDFWALGVHEMCEICELTCVNNKNPDLERIKEQKKKIDRLMKNINPDVPTFGLDANKIEEISKLYSESDDPDVQKYGEEAIKAAHLANQFFSEAMSGRQVDLAFFKAAAKYRSDRLKRLAKSDKES